MPRAVKCSWPLGYDLQDYQTNKIKWIIYSNCTKSWNCLYPKGLACN
jgi:hypothetical protein